MLVLLVGWQGGRADARNAHVCVVHRLLTRAVRWPQLYMPVWPSVQVAWFGIVAAIHGRCGSVWDLSEICLGSV